jgi:hypothetical protein
LIINLAFFVTLVVIAFGGVLFLVSYGRGKFTDDGKDWIKAGLLGLLIILCSTLIIDTINPNLHTCKLGILSVINFGNSGGTPTLPPGGFVSYTEIPIGTLTEILLTRTQMCYDFDQEGNPIYHPVQTASGTSEGGGTGEESGANYIAPRDRANCLVLQIDGAQKKAQVISALSDAISKLMNTQCDCNLYGNCQSNPCILGNGLPVGTNELCTAGTCYPSGGACFVDPSTTTPDCCNPNSGVIDPNTGRGLSVKEVIEHGPITLSFDVNGQVTTCSTDPTTGCCTNIVGTETFAGLDEFRCPNPKYPDVPCFGLYVWAHTQIEDVNGMPTAVLTEEKWKQMNLYQQLVFFKENMDSYKQDIQNDVEMLDKARTTLAKCYLAIPYVDLVKTYEATDQKDKIVFTQKLKDEATGEPITDPKTNVPVDSSKYCAGFNYANSSCYKQCNDACPAAGSADNFRAVMEAYQDCSNPNSCLNIYNQRKCPFSSNPDQTFEQCISTCQTGCGTYDYQQAVVECANLCTTGDQDCLNKCQQGSCVDPCSQQYLPCSNEYKFCESQKLEKNSACILDPANTGKCLFGADQFKNCAGQITDQGNSNYCINRAFLCKNGSDEYAGYPDCVDPLATSATNCPSKTDANSCTSTAGCIWNGLKCYQDYSATYLTKNPTTQKCPNPYDPPEDTSFCYGTSADHNTPCITLCPETSKCPGASKCPDCPCDTISQNYKYTTPQKSYAGLASYCILDPKCPPNENCSDPGSGRICIGTASGANTYGSGCSVDEDCPNPKICSFGYCVKPSNACYGTYAQNEQEVKATQIVGPQCNEYSYNDDPLTFYCQDQWWNDPNKEGNNPIPIGKERISPASGEVPVGQTVDDAKNWAAVLIGNADKMEKAIQPLLDQMIKIGRTQVTNPVQNYCKCNAQLETGESICKPDCTGTYERLPDTYSCEPGYTISDPPGTSSSTCTRAYAAEATTTCSGSCSLCLATCPEHWDVICPTPDPKDCFNSLTPAKNEFCNPTGTSCTNPNSTSSCPVLCNACTTAHCGTCNSTAIPSCTTTYSCNPGDDVSGDQCIASSPLIVTTNCKCNVPKCKGKPCLQIVDYLSQLWNYYKQFKTDFVDFYTYMLKEPRSDIMKELTYSRKTVNNCSLVNTAYGANARLLSCTRVEDELISPINNSFIKYDNENFAGYCYGTELGKILTTPKDLTDNWFCAEQYSKDPSTTNNQIYNTRE